jgi:GYF domain 2
VADEWFAEIEGETVGPVPATRLRQWAAAGRLTPDSRVRAANGSWSRFADIAPLLTPSPGVSSNVSDDSVPVVSMQDTAEWDALSHVVKGEATQEAKPLTRRAAPEEPALRRLPLPALIAGAILAVGLVAALLYALR